MDRIIKQTILILLATLSCGSAAGQIVFEKEVLIDSPLVLPRDGSHIEITESMILTPKEYYLLGKYLYYGYKYPKNGGVYVIRPNKKEAIKWFQKAAKLGNIHAQAFLGMMYVRGEAAVLDEKHISNYLFKSAENGILSAISNIGDLYYLGITVDKDKKQAAKWYRKATDGWPHKSSSRANVALGVMYFTGDGVKRSYEKGLDYLKKAQAGQGDYVAELILAYLYHKGIGVKRNEKFARTMLGSASDDGAYPARLAGVKEEKKVENLYRKISKNPNQSQVIDWLNFNKAISPEYFYFENLVAGRNTPLQNYVIGTNYYHGRNGYPQNYKDALFWLTESASAGDTISQGFLGSMYASGKGVKRDYTIAKMWFKKSAAENNSTAYLYLGKLAYNGHGQKKNIYLAEVYWEKAADLGNEDAKKILTELKGSSKSITRSQNNWAAKSSSNNRSNQQKSDLTIEDMMKDLLIIGAGAYAYSKLKDSGEKPQSAPGNGGNSCEILASSRIAKCRVGVGPCDAVGCSVGDVYCWVGDDRNESCERAVGNAILTQAGETWYCDVQDTSLRRLYYSNVVEEICG